MKISFSRGFDSEAILKIFKDAKIQGLDEFVNNVAESIDKLSNFVQKNISLADNVDQTTASYLLFHSKSLLIDPPSERKKVRAIVPFQSAAFDNPVSSFNWRYTQSGKIEIKAWFLGAPAAGQSVSMSIFY